MTKREWVKLFRTVDLVRTGEMVRVDIGVSDGRVLVYRQGDAVAILLLEKAATGKSEVVNGLEESR